MASTKNRIAGGKRTPFRSSHGKVTVVVYNRPADCGGRCTFCFRAPGVTKSTTRNEDTLLGKSVAWSSAAQLRSRVESYGLRPGAGVKLDLALKGDSFTAHDPDYLRLAMQELYDEVNGRRSGSLVDAIRLQADARDRCVTIKCETRPDRIDADVCELLGELGVTTVEIGVQSLDNRVLERVQRGHGVEAVETATRLLKQNGFEVVYQMMAGLPGSDLELDEQVLGEMLWQERFSPDAIKLYPCLLLHEGVARHEGLTAEYEGGRWRPLDDDSYAGLLDRVMPRVPRWVHVNRVQRLIPEGEVRAGPSGVLDRSRFDAASNCLWQRSVAQRSADPCFTFEDLRFVRYRQTANDWCVAAETADGTVVGYGRISRAGGVAVVRDVRVLGRMIEVGKSNDGTRGCQHRGVGTALLEELEAVAKDGGIPRIRLRPSPGTRRWFERRGYCSVSERMLERWIGHTLVECQGR